MLILLFSLIGKLFLSLFFHCDAQIMTLVQPRLMCAIDDDEMAKLILNMFIYFVLEPLLWV